MAELGLEPPLPGSLFSDTTDGAGENGKASREKGIRSASEMQGGSSTVINYLSYKFLLFCKVSTPPRRSTARWVCSGRTTQPSFQWWERERGWAPRQAPSPWGCGQSSRAGGKEQRRGRTLVGAAWELPGAPWGGSWPPLLPAAFLPLLLPVGKQSRAVLSATHTPARP